MWHGEARKKENDMLAYLSNNEKYSIFQMGDLRIKFKTSPRLQRYTEILKWDNGYIECMAKYSSFDEPIEEYIDLRVIANRLELPDDVFFDIEGVKIDGKADDG